MIRSLCAAALAFGVAVVHADMIACSPSSPCPDSAPCCSSYGFCGAGAYCLGGCDPKSSHTLQSCMAAPVCQSTDYTLNSMDDIIPNTKYLGDPSQGKWVSSGMPINYNNEGVVLTMAPNTVGTLLSSTNYVWYGKVSATLTTSQGAGVVTSFILMSDMKDEIDFEFVGTDVQTAQSNYYYQGITDYHNSANLSAPNTESTSHTYTIDWSPDTLTWAVDGKVLRTLNRKDTLNGSTYAYPQTPSRIQLSLWPAGLASNGQGTIDWAGGLVDWDSPYMQNGYYYAKVTDVSVECYDPPSGYDNQGSKAYYYTSRAGTQDTVAIGNNNTILGSFLASGDNPNYGAPQPSKSGAKSATSSAPAPTNTDVETVPGMSGTGSRGDQSSNSDANAAASSQSASAGSSDSSGSTSGSSGSSSSDGSSSRGFVQGVAGNDGTNDGSRAVAGSLIALVAFLAAA